MTRALNTLLVTGCAASILVTVFVVFPRRPRGAAAPAPPDEQPDPIALLAPITGSPAHLQEAGIARRAQLETRIPQRPEHTVTEYVVQPGDSPWSISQKFNLQPETILWGNEDLNASAGSLMPGDSLKILPVDGVLHTVKEGDALESIANLYGVPVEEVFEYIGNGFDLTRPPQLEAGQQIIVPGGTNAILWAEAQVPVEAGSSLRYSGSVPNLGTGYFSWPVNGYTLTQEYWSGHPALDLATSFRQPVFASDNGTVVFSGWSSSGYGNLVIIDHGNGFQTYYSHNEANLAAAGQTVMKGQQIAESGSTGNSTGDHLDFRIRLNSTFVNPLDYLP